MLKCWKKQSIISAYLMNHIFQTSFKLAFRKMASGHPYWLSQKLEVLSERTFWMTPKVKSLIKKPSCDITDIVIDRAHRTGKGYNVKKTNVRCKGVTVRFTTFRHRTMFYWSRANLKNNNKSLQKQLKQSKVMIM